MYRVKVTARARRALKNLSKTYKGAVILAIDELKEDATVGKPLGRELVGKFSLRIGVYRIVYKIEQSEGIVLILNVAHRSTVYN